MKNGTLQYQTNAESEIDPITGDAASVSATWSEPIDCFIQTIHKAKKGKYEDGLFTLATYMVLIELQPFEADRVKLITDTGKQLGEFQTQDIQRLNTVGRVKISV